MILAEWGNEEKTIVRWTPQGRWTWEDVYEANERVMTMLDDVPYPVGHIADLQGSELMPPGAIKHLRYLFSQKRRESDFVIIVGASTVVRALFQFLYNLPLPLFQESRMIMVSAMDEAYRVIAESGLESDSV